MMHKIEKCENCKNQPICKYTEEYTTYQENTFNNLNENEILKNIVELGIHCAFYVDKTHRIRGENNNSNIGGHCNDGFK